MVVECSDAVRGPRTSGCNAAVASCLEAFPPYLARCDGEGYPSAERLLPHSGKAFYLTGTESMSEQPHSIHRQRLCQIPCLVDIRLDATAAMEVRNEANAVGAISPAKAVCGTDRYQNKRLTP